MSSLLYFAYGSNMSDAIMRGHGGLAEAVGPARLEGWGLREREHADIEPAAGEVVDGLVWSIDEVMLAALDRYEDVPLYYERISLRVLLAAEAREVEVLSYRMTAAAAAAREGLSFSAAYARLCALGARTFGVPTHPLFRD